MAKLYEIKNGVINLDNVDAIILNDEKEYTIYLWYGKKLHTLNFKDNKDCRDKVYQEIISILK